MKTPDEIKKGLECHLAMCESADCDECPRNVYDVYEFSRDEHIKDALAYIQQLEANYQQVSKALCGKENATLDEALQAVSQVKAELEDEKLNHQHTIDIAEKQKEQIGKLKKLVVRMSKEIASISAERDAAVIALHGNCEVCRHEESLKCASCIFNEDAWNNPDDNWQWRGVCPENTEVQEDE